MSRFSEWKDNTFSKVGSQLREIQDKITDSEAYQQIRNKYDEMDPTHKNYLQWGAFGAVFIVILWSVVGGLSTVSTLKKDLDEREALIGYLRESADQIKQYKMQSQMDLGQGDASTPLGQWVDGLILGANIEKNRTELGQERAGEETKESKEILVDVKLTQVNLRQIQKFLVELYERGKKRSIAIKEFSIDTKEDPTGYMDASMVIASYQAK